MKNRSREDITIEILRTVADNPLPRTKVMYRAALSYSQLKSYEDYLVQSRLVELKDEKWTITKKGKSYLSACNQAVSILQS